MELLSELGAEILFALACNLDTVLAAVGQGVRQEEANRGSALIVAVVTTAVTFLSLILGAAGAAGWIGADRLGVLVFAGCAPGQRGKGGSKP